ncbi:hypothetical protein EDB85DRAFT_1888804 [Lactarius pseudohatsudake]|nr:hypothetical protein EDB85DRAFT_1888804 [Lactarius pseudohatsudake]
MLANTAVWERLFHTFFTPGELRDPMPHVNGDNTNDSLGHPADRIHLGVHPDDDDDDDDTHNDDTHDDDTHNDDTHNTPPTQTLAVQFAAINRPRCPTNAGCQWFHPPNTMAMAAAVATADHDTDRNSMPVARQQQQQRKRSSNDNTTATAIAVVVLGKFGLRLTQTGFEPNPNHFKWFGFGESWLKPNGLVSGLGVPNLVQTEPN